MGKFGLLVKQRNKLLIRKSIGSVAFVTGAGGTVGRTVILQFARDGIRKFAGLDILETSLEETKEALFKQFPNADFLPLVADLNDEVGVKVAFNKAVGRFGRVDYAVNNAGVGQSIKVTADTELEEFDRVLGVNVKGVWICEKLELAQMEKQEPLPSVSKM